MAAAVKQITASGQSIIPLTYSPPAASSIHIRARAKWWLLPLSPRRAALAALRIQRCFLLSRKGGIKCRQRRADRLDRLDQGRDSLVSNLQPCNDRFGLLFWTSGPQRLPRPLRDLLQVVEVEPLLVCKTDRLRDFIFWHIREAQTPRNKAARYSSTADPCLPVPPPRFPGARICSSFRRAYRFSSGPRIMAAACCIAASRCSIASSRATGVAGVPSGHADRKT